MGRNMRFMHGRNKPRGRKLKNVIPPTCPDFVQHPHLIDGRGCYTCQCSLASDEQGTSAIAIELRALGIPCDVHQTGGFTMCVYIKTGSDFTSYILANEEGFSMYKNEDDYEPESVFFGDDFKSQTPQDKAQKIINTMKEKNLQAREI